MRHGINAKRKEKHTMNSDLISRVELHREQVEKVLNEWEPCEFCGGGLLRRFHARDSRSRAQNHGGESD